ncbi:M48 family metallopeptidase [Roseburia hominis]|uniref:YgjP family zinc-dependent metalloprotease n=1 Tax=Roseburia hominis TaxID=301301 RepID=UPI001F295851|nr:M48 family metallopeptidase [Roseburia hominis]
MAKSTIHKKVEVVYSNRKSVAIQIKPDGTVVLRAPYGVPKRELNRILEEKRSWIEVHLQEIKEREAAQKALPKFSMQEINELANKALAYIPERVKYYAPIVGVNYTRITIRNQKTRWGSCSSKGGLNFNCLLMLTPPEVIDYVVVHELCHRKEMNHSKAFWAEVEKVLPDYKSAKRWLKENGGELISRMCS